MLDKHIFRHKDGGICEVYTPKAIDKLRKDKNYTEVRPEVKKENKTEKKTAIKEEE